MSIEAKPYTSEDFRGRAVKDVVLPSRLRATIEALERVTKEREALRHSIAPEAISRLQGLSAEVSAAEARAEGYRLEVEAQREAIRRGVEATVALRVERDAAHAACAEMRAALEQGLGYCGCTTHNPDCYTCQSRKALSSDAGKGWVSPEVSKSLAKERDAALVQLDEAREKNGKLREALNLALNSEADHWPYCTCGMKLSDGTDACDDKGCAALRRARELAQEAL